MEEKEAWNATPMGRGTKGAEFSEAYGIRCGGGCSTTLVGVIQILLHGAEGAFHGRRETKSMVGVARNGTTTDRRGMT